MGWILSVYLHTYQPSLELTLLPGAPHDHRIQLFFDNGGTILALIAALVAQLGANGVQGGFPEAEM